MIKKLETELSYIQLEMKRRGHKPKDLHEQENEILKKILLIKECRHVAKVAGNKRRQTGDNKT